MTKPDDMQTGARHSFSQRLMRAIKAARKAGVTVKRASIDLDGKIELGFTEPNGEIEPQREKEIEL
jgi:hypothetical protein